MNKSKPLHAFTHPDTTQEEKMQIFIYRSYEFTNVKDKTDGAQLTAAYNAFEKRMKAERKNHLATQPRMANICPELRKLKARLSK
jgi:hypothetical protein